MLHYPSRALHNNNTTHATSFIIFIDETINTRTTCTSLPFIAPLSPSSLLSIINYGGSKQENQNLRLKLKKCRRLWLRAVFACPHYHGEGISDDWYAIDERRRDQGASNERWVDTNCSFFLYHLSMSSASLNLTIPLLLLPTYTDPFLYYSIPGVREAAIALKEVDLSQANKSAVSRKTRVSFETHTSVLVEDLLDSELDGLEYPDDAGLGELDDLIDSLLLRVK